MGNLDRCQWKMVDSSEFTMGVTADRCGKLAVLKILRPFRKTDLFLCECHFNNFIGVWGLHNFVEFL